MQVSWTYTLTFKGKELIFLLHEQDGALMLSRKAENRSKTSGTNCKMILCSLHCSFSFQGPCEVEIGCWLDVFDASSSPLSPRVLFSLWLISFNREVFCFMLLSQVDAGWLNPLLPCLVLLIEPKILPALQPLEQGTAAWAHRPGRIKWHAAGSAQVGGTTVWERHLCEAASPRCCLSFQIQQDLGASASHRGTIYRWQNGQWQFASVRNRLFLFSLGYYCHVSPLTWERKI